MYLQTLSPVLTNLFFVKMNVTAIERMAMELSLEEFPLNAVRDKIFPKEDNDDIIQYFGISVALDFCFTDPVSKERFQTSWDGQIYHGSDALNACLTRALKQEWPLLSAKYLANISSRELGGVFQGDTKIPLIEDRARILNELGDGLKKYDGSFANLFRENNFRAFGHETYRGIVPTLAEKFPLAFEDMVNWGNGSVCMLPITQSFRIYFRKKAQLLCVLCHGRATTSNGKLPLINDIHKIGPMADYQIPRILVDRRAMEYSPALMKKIDDGFIFNPLSREVLEMRALTVAVLTILLDKINSLREKADPPKLPLHHGHLDAKLWPLGRKAQTPKLLCATTSF